MRPRGSSILRREIAYKSGMCPVCLDYSEKIVTHHWVENGIRHEKEICSGCNILLGHIFSIRKTWPAPLGTCKSLAHNYPSWGEQLKAGRRERLCL